MYQTFIGPTQERVIIKIISENERVAFNENIDNSDYQEYLKWLENGNIPEELPSAE